MNETITIDGKEFEVLTRDRIGEITHARLAGGKVVVIDKVLDGKYGYIHWAESTGAYVKDLEDLGIQPLKLIERKPVAFVGTVGHGDNMTCGIICVPKEAKFGMKFKCVQTTEEA